VVATGRLMKVAEMFMMISRPGQAGANTVEPRRRKDREEIAEALKRKTKSFLCYKFFAFFAPSR
jgi:hypothetical protein